MTPRDVTFVDCAGASAPRGRRRSVVVKGRRVTTVDVHAHCAVPKAMALMGRPLETDALLMAGTTLATRLRAMDAQGIDVEALSINPYWYPADRDVAKTLIAIQNEALAAICAANPDRFVAFATVALQHPDLAVAQLEEGITRYGLRGVGVGGSVNGDELADPKFHPFWAKAEALGILVFMHPQATGVASEIPGRLGGSGGLDNTIGNPLETTIALSHLIFEGTLDRFPGLKICFAHGGGYLPSYAARSNAIGTTFPKRITVPLKKKPTEYLKRLYFDSIVFTPEALRHLAAETGPRQIVMGTDYPFPWTSTSVDHIVKTPGLSADDRVAMLGGTAARLLGIKAARPVAKPVSRRAARSRTRGARRRSRG
ncbi:MAG TPA: amidohydrolase family protein [Methylomirabilota bacterium]|jgi:aminocarboxymuconate-semialdehyde decarboxylase|nr:amidohydrolase family protein [Methylomirabilota bacterium]